jgi:hypothetical protein
MLGASVGSLPKNSTTEPEDMGLSTLPYDLLLNIATYLDLRDVHALHLVSSYVVLRRNGAPGSGLDTRTDETNLTSTISRLVNLYTTHLRPALCTGSLPTISFDGVARYP